GQCTLETAKNTIITRTRQLAKRQETWFRHQADTVWIEITGEEPVEAVAERVRTIWSTYGRATLRT
ncbi:MAG: tRNA (adenosine(37)-N6)-dimethylallyltransferase MiaA, partial [Kiritimatiellae bacterium]|nr:tRNA (adenosine(37)-N6)-dimethylallyltransferase MiaA [Kiritimatiellia bacterium]